MIAVFADTFYWAALTSPADAAHKKARELGASIAPVPIVTTDEVLAEYLAFFAGARPSVRAYACSVATALLRNQSVVVVPQSRESFLSGLELYRARPDKGYSLADCISMQTMKRFGILQALTNDRHFEQEGFRALFRESTGL